jgi:DNA-directed RNA polymerase specialized sigma24 family protein
VGHEASSHPFDTGFPYDVPRIGPGDRESPTSTFALLEQAKGGDEQALSRAFERHRRRLALSRAFERHRRRLAVLIHYKLSPRAREFCEGEDLVQETCLRAFRDIGNFTYQSPGSFLRWLSAIADHAIIDRTRYQNRERRAGEVVPFRSASNPQGPEPADSQTPSRPSSNRMCPP